MSRKIMFLDESGDHSLTIIDPQYPIFVLGGIIVDLEYARGEMEERVQEFKFRLFGTQEVILHTADLVRNRGHFEEMKDRAFREKFFVELNDLMRSLEYKVVACAIKKDAHLARYGLAAINPYLLSLDVLVERFCFEIGSSRDGGVILAEKRNNPSLDNELEIAWLNLTVRGTGFLRGGQVAERVKSLTLRHKRENIAGLQLADLVVSPIGRHLLGKHIHEDWRIIESKFRRYRDTYLGAGLVVLPKE